MKPQFWRVVGWICFWLSTCPLSAVATPQISAGSELEIRLESSVSSSKAREKDQVQAVLVSPVVADHKILVPAGTKVSGVVRAVRASKEDERAQLTLDFNELAIAGAQKINISTQVASVDNARETVNEKGDIVGILASETMSTKLDQELGKLGNTGEQLTFGIEPQSNLFSNVLAKMNIMLQLRVFICHTLRGMADPEFNQVFRHPIFSQVCDAESPEGMKPQLRFSHAH